MRRQHQRNYGLLNGLFTLARERRDERQIATRDQMASVGFEDDVPSASLAEFFLKLGLVEESE